MARPRKQEYQLLLDGKALPMHKSKDLEHLKRTGRRHQRLLGGTFAISNGLGIIWSTEDEEEKGGNKNV